MVKIVKMNIERREAMQEENDGGSNEENNDERDILGTFHYDGSIHGDNSVQEGEGCRYGVFFRGCDVGKYASVGFQ